MQALSERGAVSAQHDVATPPVFHGHASDTDIIVASVNAYLKAISRMVVALGLAKRERSASQAPPPAQHESPQVLREQRP